MLKTKKKFKWVNAGPYIAAFAVPVLVMLVIFIMRGIWPFGDKCFLRTDLYHQYAPFFKELRTKLTTGGSLFYSWNIGGGTNFWALAAYYLASPTNLLVVLCPEAYVIEFVTASIVIKIGLCSVTMAYYLNRHQDRHGIDGYNGAFIGTFYALSGWMAAYNWNIMWLDCIVLFPLVILGLDRLVKENKGLLYGVSLGLCIFSNYYIAVMICMAVALYCFYLLAVEREIYRNFGTKLLKFIFYTGLAVGVSAVFLFPYIRYFSMTASASGTFKWEWYSYFSVFDMMARQMMNVEVHTGLDHWPNIYAGIAVFMLVPLYFMNRKVTLREKIGYTVLLVFFYFSFSTRAMDYIWHVLHIPNSLPCRQSFIFIFLLLVMCYKGLDGLKDRTYRDIGFSMLAALVFIFLAEKLEADKEIIKNYVIYISALFVLIYAVVFYAIKRGRMYKDVLIIILLAVAAIETCVNTAVTSVPTVRRSDYTVFDEGIGNSMDIIRENETDPFYRVEKVEFRTKNDGAWLSYPSVSTFSSCANAHLTAFYKTIGLEASTNAYGSLGQTFFTNMFMNVKYSIAQMELPESDLYTYHSGNGGNVWVYENNYTLPLGFLVEDPEAVYSWSEASSTPLKNQNEFAEKVLGYGVLFMDETPDYVSGKSISMTVDKSGFYYAYSPKSGPKEIRVTVGEDFNRKYSNLNRGYTMGVGYVKAGDTIQFENVEKDSEKSISLTLYRMNESIFKDLYEKLSKTPMIVDSFTDTEIVGHINVPEGGGLLMTTIADEDGWDVYLDGAEVPHEMLKDAYIGLKLTSGEHTLRFKYHVPLFVPSLIMTILCALIFLGIALSPLYIDKLMKVLRKEKPVPVEEIPDETEMLPDSVE